MESSKFALGKTNLKLIAIAFGVILLGFALMMGPGSTDTTFNPEIFSWRRIVLAPGISFAGFILMIFAILYQPKHRA